MSKLRPGDQVKLRLDGRWRQGRTDESGNVTVETSCEPEATGKVLCKQGRRYRVVLDAPSFGVIVVTSRMMERTTNDESPN